ncbi:hypothetical protein ABPG74_017701 [Tetrahymena malaccensis]
MLKQRKIIFVLVSLLLFCNLVISDSIFDQINPREINIISQEINQSEQDNSERKLQSSTIRFSYDDFLIKTIQNTFVQKIIINTVKVAFNFYEQFIQVKNPVVGEFKVQDCYSGGNVPEQFKKTIKNSDMHFILGASFDNQQWIARAGACNLLQGDNRPVVGVIEFNLKFLPIQDGASFSNYQQIQLVKVAIHEMFHALALNLSLYPYYVNIKQDQYGKNKDGQPFLALPEILSFAQNHFGCDKITQVFLENSGGEGTAEFHWKKSLFYQDIMTGYMTSGDLVWSGINNALLKDSGWYDVKMDFQEQLYWGKNKGCDFYFKTCDTIPAPKEYCNPNDINLPNTGFNYEGFNFQCQKTLLDDKCYYSLSVKSQSCYGRVDKSNIEENKLEKAGSSFGWSSKGITSNLSPVGSIGFLDTMQAQCYPQQCIQRNGKISIEFTIGSKINKVQKVICENDGQIITGIDGYTGKLVCPKISDFCEQQFNCKNHCKGRGFCMKQKCYCAKGYSGDDCSIINTGETQSLEAIDSLCSLYDDEGFCQSCNKGIKLNGGQCASPSSASVTTSSILMIKFTLFIILCLLF